MTAPTPRPDESQAPERATRKALAEIDEKWLNEHTSEFGIWGIARQLREFLAAEMAHSDHLGKVARDAYGEGHKAAACGLAIIATSQAAAPSLAEIDALPKMNRLVVAKLIGAKEHSGCEWRREGWAMMTWWGDRWNARRMADARETLDADYLDVEAWFYPDEIFTLRAEVSRLTDALAAETEAHEDTADRFHNALSALNDVRNQAFAAEAERDRLREIVNGMKACGSRPDRHGHKGRKATRRQAAFLAMLDRAEKAEASEALMWEIKNKAEERAYAGRISDERAELMHRRAQKAEGALEKARKNRDDIALLLFTAEAALAEREGDLADLKRQIGGGCDANNGGEHSGISQGGYRFCANCGETLRGRARAALAPDAKKGGGCDA